MAVKIFYILDSGAAGSNFGTLQDGGTIPTLATTTTGWTVAKVNAGNYSTMSYGTEVAATAFSATLFPTANSLDNTRANAWRTADRFRGTFPAGNWNISNVLRAVTNGGSQDGAWTLRIYRSRNADGTNATEITTGLVSGSVVTNLDTTGDQTSSLTLNPGAITLDSEYLFFSYGWKITGASTNNNSDVLFRTGISSSVTTTDFTSNYTYVLVHEGGYIDIE